MQTLTMAFPEGQREAKRKCYLGEKTFNDADSPYRSMFESLKEWYDKGYMPENWWLREWEADMEASYIAKKSIMILHGPWVWEKALAADPSVVQEGIPATPPAEGQETWVSWMGDVATPSRNVLYKQVMEKPEWPHILSAWNWFFSPEAVKMRAEIQGSPTVYKLDEPLDLSGGQWDGIVKEFYNEDGLYKDVALESSATGELAATRFRKEGSPGAFAVGVGLAAKTGELMTGTITVQDMLDWIQNNWEQSYDI
jgi:ABC-type glycerol-3-phosphate transport system substrate-binding protein